jgi:hypothetical protein
MVERVIKVNENRIKLPVPQTVGRTQAAHFSAAR